MMHFRNFAMIYLNNNTYSKKRDTMITEERLKGAYSEGEALAIYNEVKQSGGLITKTTWTEYSSFRAQRQSQLQK